MKRSNLMILILLVFTIVLSIPTYSNSQNLPSFKLVFHKETAVNLLVPKKTSDEDLINLITAIRKARGMQTLAKMGIPKTSIPFHTDPNAQILITIFDDPKWASESEYKKYMTTKSKSYMLAHVNHIKASYWYMSYQNKKITEIGALGYKEEDDLKSRHYKELFRLEKP